MRHVRRIFAAPALAQHSLGETSPGPDIQSDADLLAYARTRRQHALSPGRHLQDGRGPARRRRFAPARARHRGPARDRRLGDADADDRQHQRADDHDRREGRGDDQGGCRRRGSGRRSSITTGPPAQLLAPAAHEVGFAQSARRIDARLTVDRRSVPQIRHSRRTHVAPNHMAPARSNPRPSSINAGGSHILAIFEPARESPGHHGPARVAASVDHCTAITR